MATDLTTMPLWCGLGNSIVVTHSGVAISNAPIATNASMYYASATMVVYPLWLKGLKGRCYSQAGSAPLCRTEFGLSGQTRPAGGDKLCSAVIGRRAWCEPICGLGPAGTPYHSTEPRAGAQATYTTPHRAGQKAGRSLSPTPPAYGPSPSRQNDARARCWGQRRIGYASRRSG